MITLRRSEDRGRADHGWLDTRHSFSFGDYYDPAHQGFRALRVINDDRIGPGRGFPEHPHRDMEILTYILEGVLEHRDSMGNGSLIRPGEVQRMSAGTGVYHSERNPSQEEALRLLQIWILPERRDIPPSYEQRYFSDEERSGQLRLIASRDGRHGSVTIHQDASIYASLLDSGQRVEHALDAGRHVWVQVARGAVEVEGKALREGDGLSVSFEPSVVLEGAGPAEILLFDLG